MPLSAAEPVLRSTTEVPVRTGSPTLRQAHAPPSPAYADQQIDPDAVLVGPLDGWPPKCTINQAGIELAQPFPAEFPFFHLTAAKTFDHDVRPKRQLQGTSRSRSVLKSSVIPRLLRLVDM